MSMWAANLKSSHDVNFQDFGISKYKYDLYISQLSMLSILSFLVVAAMLFEHFYVLIAFVWQHSDIYKWSKSQRILLFMKIKRTMLWNTIATNVSYQEMHLYANGKTELTEL